jgi:ribosomal protein L16 Arg81 hydroxylase
VRYADREEVLGAGDLFYLPPGHTPLVEEDAEFVEFSRPAEHQPVLDHVARTAADAGLASRRLRQRARPRTTGQRLTFPRSDGAASVQATIRRLRRQAWSAGERR